MLILYSLLPYGLLSIAYLLKYLALGCYMPGFANALLLVSPHCFSTQRRGLGFIGSHKTHVLPRGRVDMFCHRTQYALNVKPW